MFNQRIHLLEVLVLALVVLAADVIATGLGLLLALLFLLLGRRGTGIGQSSRGVLRFVVVLLELTLRETQTGLIELGQGGLRGWISDELAGHGD